MRKSTIAVLVTALALMLACGGTKPNPRKKEPENKWVCATAPVDCPVQTGRQPAPTGSAK
jgi:hypothetical protein